MKSVLGQRRGLHALLTDSLRGWDQFEVYWTASLGLLRSGWERSCAPHHHGWQHQQVDICTTLGTTNRFSAPAECSGPVSSALRLGFFFGFGLGFSGTKSGSLESPGGGIGRFSVERLWLSAERNVRPPLPAMVVVVV